MTNAAESPWYAFVSYYDGPDTAVRSTSSTTTTKPERGGRDRVAVQADAVTAYAVLSEAVREQTRRSFA